MPTFLQRLRERFHKPSEPHDDPDNPSRHKPAITLAAVLLLVAAALWVVWSVPHRVVQRRMDVAHPLTVDKQLDLEDAYRKTITQIVLSVFGLYILYLSYRRAEASDKTVRIMEQGHITDRFTKAIEQLGKMENDKHNIEVRLGAIYALERIAQDSERDHWTIMEILTAYVRQNAPLDPDRPYTEGEKPRTDIQAILTVLGRRQTGPKRERSGQRLDLTKTRLCEANLYKANLQEAILWEANLQMADLRHSNLKSAILRKANLQDAFLEKSSLQDASVMGANLQAASFRDANLQGANLFLVNLRMATLEGANCENAHLAGADLQEAYLLETNLKNAKMEGANLKKVYKLTISQIKAAMDWIYAYYSPDFRAELGLPPESTESTD